LPVLRVEADFPRVAAFEVFPALPALAPVFAPFPLFTALLPVLRVEAAFPRVAAPLVFEPFAALPDPVLRTELFAFFPPFTPFPDLEALVLRVEAFPRAGDLAFPPFAVFEALPALVREDAFETLLFLPVFDFEAPALRVAALFVPFFTPLADFDLTDPDLRAADLPVALDVFLTPLAFLPFLVFESADLPFEDLVREVVLLTLPALLFTPPALRPAAVFDLTAFEVLPVLPVLRLAADLVREALLALLPLVVLTAPLLALRVEDVLVPLVDLVRPDLRDAVALVALVPFALVREEDLADLAALGDFAVVTPLVVMPLVVASLVAAPDFSAAAAFAAALFLK
jgi:hypothetical protein